MRIAYLLLLVPATLSGGGCAAMIARSGTDPNELNTKEEVHAKFGEPCASGTLDGKDGAFYEDYFTRRKIATFPDRVYGPGYAMGLAMTFGTFDLFLSSEELYLTTKRTIVGQTVRFIYDNNGKLMMLELDGDAGEFYWSNFNRNVTQNTSPSPVTPDPLPNFSFPPQP